MAVSSHKRLSPMLKLAGCGLKDRDRNRFGYLIGWDYRILNSVIIHGNQTYWPACWAAEEGNDLRRELHEAVGRCCYGNRGTR